MLRAACLFPSSPIWKPGCAAPPSARITRTIPRAMAVGLVKSPVLWLSVIERIDKPTAIVYTKLTIQQGKRSMKLLLALALVLSPLCIGAATITGQQISTTEWSYTLTFAPLDNYSIFQSDTT